MEINGWHYYNHAAMPTTPPDEPVDLTPLHDGTIWNLSGGKVFLARWITDYDCGYETNWWCTIKDEPINFELLHKRTRTRTRKGLKNFNCKRIVPEEYSEQIADVTLAAWQTYPAKYRPSKSKSEIINDVLTKWNNLKVWGAFDHEEKLCSFIAGVCNKNHITLQQVKSYPECEALEINNALMFTFLNDLKDDMANGFFVTNGQRNLSHETNYNNDLIRKWGFRKAYCKLNIEINPKYRTIINFLFFFRKILLKFDGIGLVHNINVIMKMKEYSNAKK